MNYFIFTREENEARAQAKNGSTVGDDAKCWSALKIAFRNKVRETEGSGNPRKFDCDVYPSGWDFDH